jgi:hypothetical protein
MKRILTLYLLTLLMAQSLFAQKLPTTNVYLFDTSTQEDASFKLTNPIYLTAFNNEGYNNQPYFMNNEELYLTVQLSEDTTQTDIYSLNFKTGVKTQVTATSESEYSPTYQYNMFNNIKSPPQFTCIRVEDDANASQRLWRFPLSRKNNGKAIFAGQNKIGYHAWINDYEAVLFIVDTPHRLIVANNRSGNTQNIGTNIGRCLQRNSGDEIHYVFKLSPDVWFIRAIDPVTRKTRSIVETVPGSEDFVLMPDGSILMAKDSKVYHWNPTISNDWIEIADLQNYSIGNITRLALRAGKLALVNKSPF